MLFSLPSWVSRNLYPEKSFATLTKPELDDLKERLQRFRVAAPEVSIVIPAWNEQDQVFRALSSLAYSSTRRSVEIIVINNNSTDNTNVLLDKLGVINYLQSKQGTPYARQLGLEKARGKYHLCADSDTIYPPDWVDLMIQPMEENEKTVGVYSRYCFIPPIGKSRLPYLLYEMITGIFIRIRKRKMEYINVLGLSMGFVTEVARRTEGFQVNEARMYDNALGSAYFVDEAEDGRMAMRLLEKGNLALVHNPRAKVFTSSRRLEAEGGLWNAFWHRFTAHTKKWKEYIKG
ncbi:glycosyltransferase family 2 protein [Olivibacter sitiensis]|uniref:glycosyltransferase family 2 protein n=1 Tax=Olivibacter sitiensis TaxID=376470 RepID=UPI00040EF3E0|nr:glycosyltransferase family 2 protein [Olivibacter sitiensis]